MRFFVTKNVPQNDTEERRCHPERSEGSINDSIKPKHTCSGITLLEIMLVLAIAGSIFLLGIRLYNQFKLQSDVDTVKKNVDTLFQALSMYYQANCIQYTDSSGAVIKPGALDPVKRPADPFLISPQDLSTEKFLSQWPFATNPIVAQYQTQFNLMTQERTMSDGKRLGQIYIWKPQVTVVLKSGLNVQTYKNLLGADKIEGTNNLIWERLPSFASPDTMTDLWPSMQTVKQFTQMYTTYPITSITGGYVTQNYLCGG